jgi:hypothetical protein
MNYLAHYLLNPKKSYLLHIFNYKDSNQIQTCDYFAHNEISEKDLEMESKSL